MQLLSNLPAQLTRLIGREAVAFEIGSHLLQDKVRLLTLTGPPGIGKTSLGIQVAVDLFPHIRDGVFFVALAPISEPAMVPAAIAKLFDLADSGRRPLEERLADPLRDKQMLLLDNFEQVLDASSMVLELLRTCPNLKVLVTSREALHVHGEQQFHVTALQTVEPAHLPSLDALQDVPAIALFIERARAVKPSFALTEQNAQAVVAICARLQGVPLAIELAAARVNLLSPQEMQSRLDVSVSLLASHALHLPPRQRTLRGAIDWSYQLLSEGEQKLFARLSVFVAGFTLPAAEVVDATSSVICLRSFTPFVYQASTPSRPLVCDRNWRSLTSFVASGCDSLKSGR